ncbi:MAG: Txe/YoeB family addiction module toxin [Selenomonadaceae bacterium]|nr:Txe/YoeB family addiction module toxin [Selenomonadaceae bacterium]
MNKTFSDRAFEEYIYWHENNRQNFKKINLLLRSIERDGVLKGEGKPEKLSYRKNDYSRRIDKDNRIVYEIKNGEILIKSCKGHYED